MLDCIIVGRGLMGSAAARHLAARGRRVLLIGPAEPVNKAGHDGLFASHYDEGRITRRADKSLIWSRLASRSIERYREIETQSGITFYQEVGSMMAGLPPDAGGMLMTRTLEVV